MDPLATTQPAYTRGAAVPAAPPAPRTTGRYGVPVSGSGADSSALADSAIDSTQPAIPSPRSIFDESGATAPEARPAPAAPDAASAQDATTAPATEGSLATVRSAALPEEEIHAELAPLWRRTIALALDAFIVLGASVAYLFAAASVAKLPAAPTNAVGLDLLAHQLHTWSKVLVPAAALGVLLAFVYTALFGFVWRGRTPGRKIAGIRLVDHQGRAPHPIRAVVRAALALPSFAIVLGGFWLAVFDRYGQTLHDKLARTFVVRDD